MKPKLKQQIVDNALSLIDKATEPYNMDKSEAKAVIEQIMADLQCRIDCIEDELKAEETENIPISK